MTEHPTYSGRQSAGGARCTHTAPQQTWIPEEEYSCGHVEPAHWHCATVSTYEDIDVGRFCCTQCGEVFYYTGLWRQHWEGGRKLLDERTGCIKGGSA